MKPNFLFIGPDKTGSTWLHHVLLQHPECYVPSCKDIYFFDRYYDRGMDWYLSFFKNAPSHVKVMGELSHDYLFSDAAAERIARQLPGVKLISSLRDPAERSFSHYLYMVRSGRTRAPFEEALTKFPELIDKSLYHKHLSRYFRRFDRSQMGIFFFEDLKADPERFARGIFEFLDLPFLESIGRSDTVLPASRPRSFILARLAKMGANISRDMGFTNLVGTVKYSFLAKLLYRGYSEDNRPRLDPETRHVLMKLFEPDIRQLQDLLEKDLSHWE